MGRERVGYFFQDGGFKRAKACGYIGEEILGLAGRLRHCLHGRGFICNRIGFDAVTPFVYTEPAEFVIKTGSF